MLSQLSPVSAPAVPAPVACTGQENPGLPGGGRAADLRHGRGGACGGGRALAARAPAPPPPLAPPRQTTPRLAGPTKCSEAPPRQAPPCPASCLRVLLVPTWQFLLAGSTSLPVWASAAAQPCLSTSPWPPATWSASTSTTRCAATTCPRAPG